MPNRQIIAISPAHFMENESTVINDLFEAGLYRYHIAKVGATEQWLAEILQDVLPEHLSSISLHSHYHLVLAYGVGGIHFEENVRQQLGDDFIPKVRLYQGFGIQVSSTLIKDDVHLSTLNYVMGSDTDFPIRTVPFFNFTTFDKSTSKRIALHPKIWDSETPKQSIISLLNGK